MKTRRVTIFLFFFYFSTNIFGQYIQAGINTSQDYHFNIIPDTIITTLSTTSGIASFYLDINNDSIDDFEISVIIDDFGNWHHYESSIITPLNNNQIAIQRYDSCFAFCPPPDYLYNLPMVKSFLFNDSINNSNLWIDSAASLSFTKWSATIPNNCGYSCSGNTFLGASEFIGIRIITSNDSLYGWIKASGISSDTILVEEFACNKLQTSIDHLQYNSSLTIYPNPTTGIFELTIEKLKYSNYNLNIYNLLGVKVYFSKINSRKTKIDLRGIQKGIYFIKIDSEYDSITNKIIIE